MTEFTPPNYGASPLPPPNPITRRTHRREVVRQITSPLLLTLFLVSAAVYFLASSQITSAERWGEVSTIIMIAILLVGLMIPLALVAALIFLISRLLGILPVYARQTQLAIERVQRQVRTGADISVQPLLQIQSFFAMLNTLFGRKK